MTDRDLAIWNALFERVPDAWREAPPSEGMLACKRFLQEVGARNVLDLGCGVGRYALFLAGHGFRVTGVDYAPNAIRCCGQWAEDAGVEATFICGDISDTALPGLAGQNFDAVVAALVLDNMSRERMACAVRAIAGYLRPRGHLFAVFNPVTIPEEGHDNPTQGITRVVYSDDDILQALPGFELLRREVYEMGTRGFLLRKAGGAATPGPEHPPERTEK